MHLALHCLPTVPKFYLPNYLVCMVIYKRAHDAPRPPSPLAAARHPMALLCDRPVPAGTLGGWQLGPREQIPHV